MKPLTQRGVRLTFKLRGYFLNRSKNSERSVAIRCYFTILLARPRKKKSVSSFLLSVTQQQKTGPWRYSSAWCLRPLNTAEASLRLPKLYRLTRLQLEPISNQNRLYRSDSMTRHWTERSCASMFIWVHRYFCVWDSLHDATTIKWCFKTAKSKSLFYINHAMELDCWDFKSEDSRIHREKLQSEVFSLGLSIV